MFRRSSLTGFAVLLILILPAVFFANLFLAPTEVARGKTAAAPLSDELTPDQQTAQDLALADSRVQQYTVGQRTEVFGVAKMLDINTPVNDKGCNIGNCMIVNIFNFDASATVQAFVRLDTREVVEVYNQPNVRPGINKRLADRAMEIALNDPEVIAVIGEQRASSDWAPMDATLVGSECEQGHMCVAPTFNMGDYIFWAIVDLTDERLAGTFWTGIDGTATAYEYPNAYGVLGESAGGCPAPGTVTNRDGWTLSYNNTGTDSLRISEASYNGTMVITSAKLVEWHADYGNSGYQDSTGCGGGGGGFPIYPVGETVINNLMDGSNVIGFEVVQLFSMGSWGSGCNYRYDQHFQFYADGSFRTVEGAYGKGCGQNSLYRGLMRIDLAVGGTAEGDSIAYWNGSDWTTQTTEKRWCPEGDANAGCTGANQGSNSDGYRFRITDGTSGEGYYIEPGRGQFGDNGRGDFEFIYATVHSASEGDNDLPVFGAGCCNDYNHGPETYVNGQSIENADITLWYIPQMQTQATAPDYYCWTLTPPTTYPCFSGPMFRPTAEEPTSAPQAAFSMPDAPYFATDYAIQFTDESVPGMPATLNYDWAFGDGGTSTAQNPTHAYTTAGNYTVSLTVDNGVYSDTVTAPVTIYNAVQADFDVPAGTLYVNTPVQFMNQSGEGLNPDSLTYNWTFGDGGASTDVNPVHTYTMAGNYDVTLIAGNGYFTDTLTAPVTIFQQPTAVTLDTLSTATGNGMMPWLVAGLAGIAIAGISLATLRRR